MLDIATTTTTLCLCLSLLGMLVWESTTGQNFLVSLSSLWLRLLFIWVLDPQKCCSRKMTRMEEMIIENAMNNQWFTSPVLTSLFSHFRFRGWYSTPIKSKTDQIKNENNALHATSKQSSFFLQPSWPGLNPKSEMDQRTRRWSHRIAIGHKKRLSCQESQPRKSHD